MSPINNKLQYSPGQYIFVRFTDKNVSHESHPFSITSTPNEEQLSIIAKNLGDYTATLQQLTIGSRAEIEGPFGNFGSEPITSPQIWIGGGIGITPFIGLAKNLPPNLQYNIDLYYCVKNRNEFIELEDLQAISTNNPMFRVIPFCSDTQGYLNVEMIKKTSGDISQFQFLLCAPPVMIQSLRDALLQSGVQIGKIHSEEFDF